MKQLHSMYTSGEYTKNNPSYHVEDSAFKWRNFVTCMELASRKSLISLDNIHSVAEVGCGAGQILANAKKSCLFSDATYEGWDINPEAIDIAKKLSPDINFFCSDIIVSTSSFDLVLCADVFEHLEDPFTFLRNLKPKAKYFLFNIPLEMCLLNMIRGEHIFWRSYESVGHLQFYNRSSALQQLKVCGFDVIETCFARNRTRHSFLLSPSFKRLLTTTTALLIENISQNLSASLLGDSLIVLAK